MQGRRALALEQGQEIVTLLPFSSPQAAVLTPNGSDPAVSFDGRTFAWEANDDPLRRDLPGWQIVLSQDGKLLAGVTDPSGTSGNPSLDKRGATLVFESAGDLTNVGGPAALNRVYVRDKNGALALASMGDGTSGKAMVSAKGGLVIFESTSDPLTGADTGTTQIWAGRVNSLPAQRITAGMRASTDPIVSDDGRLIVFVSTAALGAGGADVGVAQVFVHDTRTQTFAQLTDEWPGYGHALHAVSQRSLRPAAGRGGNGPQAAVHRRRGRARLRLPAAPVAPLATG